jgi:hypothetical protein
VNQNFLPRQPLALIAFSAFLVCSVFAQETQKPGQEIHQLRIYEIFEINKAAFHARFRDHAMRIMKKYGFDIVAIWEAKSAKRTYFVYILRWPNEQTMTECWSRFMADQEWADIKKKTAAMHGKLVGEIQDRVLRPTDYSPRLRPH